MSFGDILTAAQMRELVNAAGAGWLTVDGASEPYSADDLTDDLSFQAVGGNEFRVIGADAIITICGACIEYTKAEILSGYGGDEEDFDEILEELDGKTLVVRLSNEKYLIKNFEDEE